MATRQAVKAKPAAKNDTDDQILGKSGSAPTLLSEVQTPAAARLAPKKEERNLTGIPTQMKNSFEAKSGFSFDDVRVHYNSEKPEQLQALAYTQGNQVYVAPGQEKHLPHELGHVAQQKRGLVKPTGTVNGVPVNTDEALERAADSLSPISPDGRAAMNEAGANMSNPAAQRMGTEEAALVGVGATALAFLVYGIVETIRYCFKGKGSAPEVTEKKDDTQKTKEDNPVEETSFKLKEKPVKRPPVKKEEETIRRRVVQPPSEKVKAPEKEIVPVSDEQLKQAIALLARLDEEIGKLEGKAKRDLQSLSRRLDRLIKKPNPKTFEQELGEIERDPLMQLLPKKTKTRGIQQQQAPPPPPPPQPVHQPPTGYEKYTAYGHDVYIKSDLKLNTQAKNLILNAAYDRRKALHESDKTRGFDPKKENWYVHLYGPNTLYACKDDGTHTDGIKKITVTKQGYVNDGIHIFS